MALRVVSLPATTSRMKKDATSAAVSASPSMLVVDQGRGDVVGRVDPPLLGELRHEHRELLPRFHEGHEWVGVPRDVLGVALAEDDIGRGGKRRRSPTGRFPSSRR